MGINQRERDGDRVGVGEKAPSTRLIAGGMPSVRRGNTQDRGGKESPALPAVWGRTGRS
jgi:hypothetical protein